MQIVIMAGGRGTRIARLNTEVPKPMIPIEGIPILERQLGVLRQQGYTNITLAVGYLGDKIKKYFGDGHKVSPVMGQPFGVSLRYVEEDEPLGTAGALYFLRNFIKEDFLLLNGDIVFDVDIRRFYKYHKERRGLATILTHPNGHPYDSGIICKDKDGRVTDWLHKEDKRLWYQNRVNAGLHILSADILNLPVFQMLQRVDLDRDVLKPLIAERKLFAYDSPEYVKDMGTPERYYEVAEDIRTGLAASKNLSVKQKAVFLDRDGTLNRYVGFLRRTDDLELMEGAAEAVKKINRSGYLAIVVTNQPVIARGEVTVDELETIHQKLETLLGAEGAYLDAVYYCPHHPDKGFEGEVTELKLKCNCRKPEPGMLLQAAEDYNIDLNESWMIGDDDNDILAGKTAGCKTILLTNAKGRKGECNLLLEAVNLIDRLCWKL
ncbi:MAG: HAD-IIIA family hydrolase [Lachnospiraceae bacterium]|nr:HAD-IIIA family hydrolase [Lachnospiraceae bacterium]